MTGATIVAVAIVAGSLGMSSALAEDPSDEPLQLEEVIVTAKKYEQSLQDVAISITALSSEDLVTAGVKTTEDLAVAVPGLNITRSLSTIAPILRGVGNYAVYAGFEGAVATYVDEVYHPSPHSALFNLVNVERVEVLRGPQGTLFGRNSTGGLIHVVTKTPSTETSGMFSLGYGSQDTVEGKLYATTGLSENIAADISLFNRDQGEGFGENLATGNDVFFRDEFAARTKILFDYDKTRLVLSADYTESTSDFGVMRRPHEGTTALLGTPPPDDFFDMNSAEDHEADTDIWGVSAHFTREFDDFDVIAVLSGREYDFELTLDQGESSLPYLPVHYPVDGESESAELRVQSSGDATLKWVLGAYYFGANDVTDRSRIFAPGIIVITAMAPGGPFELLTRLTRQEATSFALFGETVWSVSDRSNITLGYRYTEDERDFTQEIQFTTSALSPLGQGAVLGPPVYEDSETFTEPSWRITVDHSFGEEADHLVFASVSHGFKSGVYNANGEGPAAGPLDPEILDAYEIGFKSVLADNRLRINGTAFYYEYDDLLVSTQRAGAAIVSNAAESEIKGLELEMLAALTSELDINMTASWVDAEFKSFPDAELTRANPNRLPCPGAGPTPNCVFHGSAAGNGLPRTPELTLSAGANYSRVISPGILGLGINVFYSDSAPQDYANRLEIDSYTIVNANASLALGDKGQFVIRLYGQNLGDEEYHSYMTATALGDYVAPAPGRQYGVTFEYHWL